mmetsp:Transcript_1168/g.2647  ORF Transcript_1168/g.2647 Transcript_1168/m.2647 type:complete len:423 (-) Transcript_1168:25-1293(-)
MRSFFLSRCLPFFILFRSHSALISTLSTTKSSTTALYSIDDSVPNCWEAELWKVSEPLSTAPPTFSGSLEVLKRDGVVRLNPDVFRVDERLCAALRDRILAEMENPKSDDRKPGDNSIDQYVRGTRLRPGEGVVDLAFGGDVRHDILLPLNDENFSEVRPVLESAAQQLEPLLLVAAEQLLPRLHGSSSSGSTSDSDNNIQGNNFAADPSPLELSSLKLKQEILEKNLSGEVTEVASLLVRQGSGHQTLHGDYRRYTGGNDDSQQEEPLAHTEARDGLMPPRIVTFVALQDIPSNEHGATGFVTGSHTAYAHGLKYGESTDADLAKARQDILQASTSGVRTSRGFRRGEMLMYDASVLHWGGANSMPNNDRAIFYFGVSRVGAAAKLAENQPELKGLESVPPILLNDMAAEPSRKRVMQTMV